VSEFNSEAAERQGIAGNLAKMGGIVAKLGGI
jgi:hypothetical protein